MVMDSFISINNQGFNLKLEFWNIQNSVTLTLSRLESFWYIYAPNSTNRIVAIYRTLAGPVAMNHHPHNIHYHHMTFDTLNPNLDQGCSHKKCHF